jgi:hypothetical protein
MADRDGAHPLPHEAISLDRVADALPTARTMLPQAAWLCLLVWCQACRRQSPADLQALVAAGRGDVPVIRLRFRCTRCGSRLRLKASTIAAIETRARADGGTLKQVICRALAEAGVQVAAADLEDGTPRRRAAA